MSGRVFVGGVAIVLVAYALCLTDLVLGLMPGPTEANAKRIKPGMTMRDVEGVLGERGQETPLSGITHLGCIDTMYEWTGPTGVVYIVFVQSLFDSKPAVVVDVSFKRTAGPNLLEWFVLKYHDGLWTTIRFEWSHTTPYYRSGLISAAHFLLDAIDQAAEK